MVKKRNHNNFATTTGVALGQAVLVSFPLLLGYAISTVCILLWLTNDYDPFVSKVEQWDIFVSNILYSRYQFSSGFCYPYSDTVHPSVLVSVMFVLALSMGCFCVFHVFVPSPVRSTSGRDRSRLKSIWMDSVRLARRTSLRRSLFLFGFGYFGAWFGLASDVVIAEVRFRIDLRSLTPTFDHEPEPIIGWFSASDLVWISLVIIGVCYFSIIRPARKRFARSKYIAKRWCRSCGYPATGLSGSNCPECGAPETAY